MAAVAVATLCLVGAADVNAGESNPDPAATSPLEEALLAARDNAGGFYLRIDCASDKGARNLELYPDGIAIWDNRLELELPQDERRALVVMMLDQEFASLEPEYGGKTQTEGMKAPLRISCGIEFRAEDVSKRSQQFVDGFQSPRLNGLANALLDRVAPLAEADGSGIETLEQGLTMLSEGELSAHGFGLRFVELPTDDTAGTILQVRGDVASIRAYQPGVEIGEAVTVELDADRIRAITEALLEANLDSFPINLWSNQYIEFEARMLDRKKRLIARDFMRLGPEQLGETQRRFNSLIDRLRQIQSQLD